MRGPRENSLKRQSQRPIILKMVVEERGGIRLVDFKAIVLQAADVKSRQNRREALTGSGKLLLIYITLYICM